MKMMIQYRVEPTRLDEHRALLTDVFAELAHLQPAGLTYTTYALDDGQSFVDIVEGPALPTPLNGLPAFQRYRAGLDERTTTAIHAGELTKVFTYRAPEHGEPGGHAADGLWFTDDEIAYLSSQPLGRLATVDATGTPQNNPVGFTLDVEQRQLVIGGLDLGSSRKYRNVRRHPGVAFVVDDLASIDPWTPRGIEIRGTATVATDQEPPMEGFSRETIRITPRWIGTWGVSPGSSFDMDVRHSTSTQAQITSAAVG
jgi:pyridoxamine 5'-phosphate oxidase family protein